VNITDRDKKIVLVLVPLVVLLGYWFLLLGPKRKEAKSAGDGLAKQERRLGDARAHERGLAGAKSSFASDYTQLVRLGKAVPTSLDMPSLLVQLDSAARGTGISFSRIASGDRTAAGSSAAPAASSTPPSGSGSGANGSSAPAGAASQAGGQSAQTGLGKATEKAHENANATSQKSTSDANASATDTSTSTQTGKGGLPVGGGSGAAGAPTGAGGTQVAGLDSVPLELAFEGNFFNLADFFHRLKRFVHVFNSQVVVRGRLMTVDGLKFSSDTQIFPRLKAELTATIYLSPKAQGATAGASPQGPASSGGQSAAATPGGGSSGPGSVPTATATPGSP
jgi:hypothetical protein